MAETERTCRQEDRTSGVGIRICDSPLSQPPAVRAVQMAIVARLRSWIDQELVADALFPLGRGQQACIEILPGAGAWLTADTLETLRSLASRRAGLRLTLPLGSLAGSATLDAPYNLETCFSVETGADIIALSLHPHTGPALHAVIQAPATASARMARTLKCFGDRDAEIALVGPIQNATWRFLEDRAACRVRLFADGADDVPGLASAMLRQGGPAAFCKWISQVGDAIFFDSRSLFAGREQPGEMDYYYSDIGEVERIENAELRSLTEMALACDKPFILGGPSIVNGVQYAIVDAAWQSSENPDRGYQIAW